MATLTLRTRGIVPQSPRLIAEMHAALRWDRADRHRQRLHRLPVGPGPWTMGRWVWLGVRHGR